MNFEHNYNPERFTACFQITFRGKDSLQLSTTFTVILSLLSFFGRQVVTLYFSNADHLFGCECVLEWFDFQCGSCKKQHTHLHPHPHPHTQA